MKKVEFQEAYFIKSFNDFPYMDYNTISINFINTFNVPLYLQQDNLITINQDF